MSRRSGNARAYMEDMLEYARHIQAFLNNKTQQEYLADVMLQFAVIRAIEVLGEAAKQFEILVPDAEQRFPGIPFREIYATRNRLIHGYSSIKPESVWKIGSQEIAPLAAALEQHLLSWPADLT